VGRLLTKAQFARRTRYSKARVSQFVKSGVIKVIDGLIDPIEGEMAIRAAVGHLHHPRERRSRLKFFSGDKPVEFCDQCDANGGSEVWFCKKLNLTFSKGRDAEERTGPEQSGGSCI